MRPVVVLSQPPQGSTCFDPEMLPCLTVWSGYLSHHSLSPTSYLHQQSCSSLKVFCFFLQSRLTLLSQSTRGHISLILTILSFSPESINPDPQSFQLQQLTYLYLPVSAQSGHLTELRRVWKRWLQGVSADKKCWQRSMLGMKCNEAGIPTAQMRATLTLKCYHSSK